MTMINSNNIVGDDGIGVSHHLAHTVCLGVAAPVHHSIQLSSRSCSVIGLWLTFVLELCWGLPLVASAVTRAHMVCSVPSSFLFVSLSLFLSLLVAFFVFLRSPLWLLLLTSDFSSHFALSHLSGLSRTQPRGSLPHNLLGCPTWPMIV